MNVVREEVISKNSCEDPCIIRNKAQGASCTLAGSVNSRWWAIHTWSNRWWYFRCSFLYLKLTLPLFVVYLTEFIPTGLNESTTDGCNKGQGSARAPNILSEGIAKHSSECLYGCGNGCGDGFRDPSPICSPEKSMLTPIYCKSLYVHACMNNVPLFLE